MLFFLALIGSLAVGVSSSVQGSINAALARRSDAIFAGVVSCSVGTIGTLAIMIALSLITGDTPFTSIDNTSPWMYIGGILGVIALMLATAAMTKMGAALTAMIQLATTMTTSFLIDVFGLVGMPVVSPDWIRVLAIAGFFVGAFLIYIGKKKSVESYSNKNAGKDIVLGVIFSITAGVLGGFMGPISATLGSHVGTLPSSFIYFLTGALTSLAIYLVMNRGRISAPADAPLWNFSAGFFGTFNVSINILVLGVLGAALNTAVNQFGILLASATIDTKGLIAMPKTAMDRWRIAGIIIIGISIAIMLVSSRTLFA